MIANQFTAWAVLWEVHLVQFQHFGDPDLIGMTSARIRPSTGDVIGKRFFSLLAIIRAASRASSELTILDDPDRIASALPLPEPEPCAFPVLRHVSLHASHEARVII